MATFLYAARDAVTSQQVESSISAASQPEAIAALMDRNLLVLTIEEKAPKQGRTSGGRVDLAELVAFTRQLATMVDAGLAIVQCL